MSGCTNAAADYIQSESLQSSVLGRNILSVPTHVLCETIRTLISDGRMQLSSLRVASSINQDPVIISAAEKEMLVYSNGFAGEGR